MKAVKITDCTLRLPLPGQAAPSFREKVEMIKELDRLCLDAIELQLRTDHRADSLLLKTVAPLLKNGALCCRCALQEDAIDRCWEAISEAARPRIQLAFPTSTVQMVYLGGCKPAALLEQIRILTAKAASLCPEVEFVALDASRSEEDFLYRAIGTAIEAGATHLTLCDSAGILLPQETLAFLNRLHEHLPAVESCVLGMECSEKMHMASACMVAAAQGGVTLLKTALGNSELPRCIDFADVLQARGETLGLSCDLRFTVLGQVGNRIEAMLPGRQNSRSSSTAEVVLRQEDFRLRSSDHAETVTACVKKLGYELSEEDLSHVYESFCRVARKKEIGPQELDAIVASAAMQVAPTYRLRSYVANSSNFMSSTAQIELEKEGSVLQGISLGDGPIDAAFRAIESILGHHYDLDDFQIRSVTQGKEAMGEALVKLRSEGKLYAGRGISTDIIAASIRAYISALNKICWEEAMA